MPIEAGIRELKTNLSAYLRRIKAGETLIITERGVPIGRITPIAPSATERIETLIAAGHAAWSGQMLPPRAPAVQAQGSRTVADLLIEDRE